MTNQVNDREQAITGFLLNAGWDTAKRERLAGDASARRYDRLCLNGKPAILMNAPPENGLSVEPFLTVGKILTDCGGSVPEIYAQDRDLGLLLMEDFGDDLFARICADQQEQEEPLYRAAVDMLWHIQTECPAEDLPPYDMSVYLRESRLLLEWYLPAATGRDVDEDTMSDFSNLITDVCAPLLSDPQVMIMRDYHAENLLWLPHRAGVKRVGLLDFQDALCGHPAYDLVSLLEDARRDTSPELRDRMIAYYLEISGRDEKAYIAAYNTLGFQRNSKIMGIFTRLLVQDGKSGYVRLLPRVWDHLKRDLQDPALSRLRHWMDKNVPEPTPEIQSKIHEAAHAP